MSDLDDVSLKILEVIVIGAVNMWISAVNADRASLSTCA
jgi:hypothetical protein